MELGSMVMIGGAVLGVLLLLSCFYTVEQQEEAIVERFGKYVRSAKPGLNLRIPLVENVYKSNMLLQELEVPIETKTKDNVFVKCKVAVQYQIEDVVKANYRLSNVKNQLSSYVFDVVRSEVPKQTLDEVFANKDEVALAVKKELAENMKEFGYTIRQALVVDIDPDPKVKDAMNDINAAQRQRMAANERGEADKILKVKAAEADAEAKKLQGRGIADERAEIVKGLSENIASLKTATHADTSEIFSLLILTQHYDTLKSLGHNANTNTVMVPYHPGAVGETQAQMMGALEMSKTHTARMTGSASHAPTAHTVTPTAETVAKTTTKQTPA